MESSPYEPSQTSRLEPHCEWVGTVEEQLQLPDFPHLNDFELSVPSVPRLLPVWERLQSRPVCLFAFASCTEQLGLSKYTAMSFRVGLFDF